ncbi:mannose/fructose/sorbose PTS transporter subunit IIB [Brochothrix campestris]|uniref:PTS system mannose-specific transporter subunits IIAB n=1 Tax=Brochothrix campestris FSL F6-1037 TaxID=1265861 RepID=W7CXH1_9LIST|nr:mannose/fructose/sorbose PTS transporter subunit IIB [Brochothrix campestris]EUJ41395.1 PTS system mannose-specific transporter subunits IIAB [Brochothrix campestris FSL F6-1037]
MHIKLARIDDRLIHGQVATSWSKASGITRIIVANDAVAADPVRSTMLKQVAPPGISAHVVSLEKALRVYRNPKYAADAVMFLFTNPTDVLSLIEQGLPLTTINIGGMSYTQGKQMINNFLAVDEIDINAFKSLAARAIELEVRVITSDAKLDLMSLLQQKNII